jgi:Xaa-Pro aminopeptidase
MAVDDQRHASIMAALRSSSCHALVSSSASSVLLLTGYWPVMGISVAVFPSDGEVAILLPEDEVELASATTSARLVPFHPQTLEHLNPPIKAVGAALKPLLSSLRLSGKAVGVELRQAMQPASYAASVRFRESLVDVLESFRLGAHFVASEPWLGPLRATKTPTELGLMQKAADVAEDGFIEAARCIAPGLREDEIAARVQAAFASSPKATGLERSYGFFYCMSGPNSAKASAAYARTRRRVVEDGDLVMIHANTCADGYWTDITRTYTAGQPRQRHAAMRTAIAEARGKALEAVKPGAKASEVDHAARSVMAAHGFGEAFRHATGHGVGFGAANPDGLPRIHPKSPDILAENMTFNIEPAAYFDGYGGMRHCDVVAVTSTGARVLTDY